MRSLDGPSPATSRSGWGEGRRTAGVSSPPRSSNIVKAGGGAEQVDGATSPRSHATPTLEAHREERSHACPVERRLPVTCSGSGRTLRGPRIRRVQRRQGRCSYFVSNRSSAGGEGPRPARVLPRPQQADRVQVTRAVAARSARRQTSRARSTLVRRRGQDRAGRRRDRTAHGASRPPAAPTQPAPPTPAPRLSRPTRTARKRRRRHRPDPRARAARARVAPWEQSRCGLKGKVEDHRSKSQWAEGDGYVSKAIPHLE